MLIQSAWSRAGGAMDIAFWFMEDARYTGGSSRGPSAGTFSVRVLMDPRANSTYVR